VYLPLPGHTLRMNGLAVIVAGTTALKNMRTQISGCVVLLCSLLSAFYFTWRKAKKNRVPMWEHTSKKLLINLLIPLVAGGLFVLGLLYHHEWIFVAPVCLVFYGLALVNASKYTLTDIRYIGLIEIVLGLINMFWPPYSLFFWAIGFGLLHIIYGWIMWRKYDKTQIA
jgi:hypothetical protein